MLYIHSASWTFHMKKARMNATCVKNFKTIRKPACRENGVNFEKPNVKRKSANAGSAL
jgi:hypothetical protein